MLASFTQFVKDAGNALSPNLARQPSSTQVTQQNNNNRPGAAETDIASTASATDHEDKQSVADADLEVKEERKRRDKRSVVYETFIVVRPPPSMSNHPLNLQLQLVPPSSRDTQRVASASRSGTMDSQMTDSTRQRSPSVRSNRSATSLYSSASFSTASIASSTASTSTASARRIIPLYNLSAHNVMTNTVTDAGTDAKIAKFGKRGIEIIGLGILECYEVLGVQLDPAALALYLPHNGTPGPSVLPPIEVPSSRSSSRPPSTVTPSSSTSHLPSELQHPSVSTPTAPSSQLSTQTPSTPTANSAKKLFGKMFKRKDAASSPATPTPIATPTPTGIPEPPTTPTPTTPSFFNRQPNRASALSASSATGSDLAHGKVASSSSAQDLSAGAAAATSSAGALQPPVLGTQATLLYRTKSRSTVIPPSVITNLTGNALALRKSRSKSSFQADEQLQVPPGTAAAAKSREASSNGAVAHLQVDHLSPPGAATEIHLEGSASSLGLAPPPTYKRTGHSYEWVIRRWIKGSDAGLFGIKESLLSARSAVFDIPASGGVREGMVEVRFEWVKGKGSKERAKAKDRERLGVDAAGEGRRSRPRSMVSDTAEAFGAEHATSSSLRPASMYVGGTAPVTPEKRRGAASTTTSPTSDMRSPSPGVRPSMESLRRSSDGSGDNPTSSVGHNNEASGTVYKGGRPSARRPSMKEKDRGRMALDDATDEDSDPEDSETPWTCTLHVGPPMNCAILQAPADPTAPLTLTGTRTSITGSRSTGAIGGGPIPPPDFTGGTLHKRVSTSSSSHFPASASAKQQTFGLPARKHSKASTEGAPAYAGVDENAQPAQKPYRLKLATMTPAPHHPKVVSQLRMPYPLPDVNVDKMKVSTGDEEEERGDLILTMEDIKDVVCVTGLWLIVREGFGGLERRRKGDGWKIRG